MPKITPLDPTVLGIACLVIEAGKLLENIQLSRDTYAMHWRVPADFERSIEQLAANSGGEVYKHFGHLPLRYEAVNEIELVIRGRK